MQWSARPCITSSPGCWRCRTTPAALPGHRANLHSRAGAIEPALDLTGQEPESIKSPAAAAHAARSGIIRLQAVLREPPMTAKEMTAAEHAPDRARLPRRRRPGVRRRRPPARLGETLWRRHPGHNRRLPAARLAIYEPPRDETAVSELARELEEPLIGGGFIAAENFHRNFFHDHMEDYEREADRPSVHHFVAQLLALLDNAAGPTGPSG